MFIMGYRLQIRWIGKDKPIGYKEYNLSFGS